jgi:hypothetical protein
MTRLMMEIENKRTAMNEIGLPVEEVESLQHVKGDASHHVHVHPSAVHYLPHVGQ